MSSFTGLEAPRKWHLALRGAGLYSAWQGQSGNAGQWGAALGKGPIREQLKNQPIPEENCERGT